MHPSCMDAIQSLLSIFIVAGIITCTHAWSGDIHRIVAQIASDPSLLSERALDFILEHFPDTDTRSAPDALVPVADWADKISASDDYHFTYTPFRNCQPFDLDRDCGSGPTTGRCLVTGLQLYFDRASDLSVTAYERRLAIQFLVHFVADATQPLHTGFREDAGGNGISLSEPSELTLHELWDQGLLDHHRESLGGSTWEGIAHRLIPQALDHQSELQLTPGSFADNTFAARMVTDTVMGFTCRSAYSADGPGSWIESGSAVSSSYMTTRSAIVLHQLTKAGVWLSQLLNAVAGIYTARTAASRAEAKEAARAAFVATTMAPDRPIGTSSYFSVIELKFDPEAHLYSGDVYAATTRMKQPGKDKRSQSRKLKTAAGATAAAVVDDDDDALLEAAAANNKKHFHYGIHMDSLILIKVHGVYRITSRWNGLPRGAAPAVSVVFEVVLTEGGPPVTFLFDRAVFTDPDSIDQPMITVVFAYLAGAALSAAGLPEVARVSATRYVDPFEEIRLKFPVPPTSSGLRPFNLTRSAIIDACVPRIPIRSAGVLSDAAFAKLMPRMVFISFGKVGLISSEALLRDLSTERIRVNVFPAPQQRVLYVDVRLHDGDITPLIGESIKRLAISPRTRKLTDGVLVRHPLIGYAIAQIDFILNPVLDAPEILTKRAFVGAVPVNASSVNPFETIELILVSNRRSDIIDTSTLASPEDFLG